jgi:hypothetical protein
MSGGKAKSLARFAESFDSLSRLAAYGISWHSPVLSCIDAIREMQETVRRPVNRGRLNIDPLEGFETIWQSHRNWV